MTSRRWRENIKTVAYNCCHTGTTGLHGSAVILGEYYQSDNQASNPVITVRFAPNSLQQLAMQCDYYQSDNQVFNPVITVRLEPKNLQQLAMQMVYEKVELAHWDMLPNKLKCRMMGT